MAVRRPACRLSRVFALAFVVLYELARPTSPTPARFSPAPTQGLTVSVCPGVAICLRSLRPRQNPLSRCRHVSSCSCSPSDLKSNSTRRRYLRRASLRGFATPGSRARVLGRGA